MGQADDELSERDGVDDLPYGLPKRAWSDDDPEWTDEQLHEYMTQYRAREQAMQQTNVNGNHSTRRGIKQLWDRLQRRVKARTETLNLEDWR